MKQKNKKKNKEAKDKNEVTRFNWFIERRSHP